MNEKNLRVNALVRDFNELCYAIEHEDVSEDDIREDYGYACGMLWAMVHLEAISERETLDMKAELREAEIMGLDRLGKLVKGEG